VDDIHYLFHWASCMSVFKEVLGKSRPVVPVFENSKIFLKSSFERPFRLSCYFILQSGQVRWYIPVFSYLFWSVPCLVARRLSIVLSAVNVTLTSVFLNSFVINFVSFLVYVNFAHFPFRISCFCFFSLLYLLKVEAS